MAENELIPRLFGAYLLTEKLGTDALGKVYRARKIEDAQAFFRLRIFDAAGLDSEPVLIAIEQNGAVHDFLKNPTIARDVELDSVEGDAFLAYREPGGRTLDALLEASHSKPFPIPPEHSLLIAEKIATGLDHAYNSLIDGERTLHGLVWPGFVEISDEGETRLVGFGLSEGVLASRRTPAIQKLLDPYLAPEVRSSGKAAKTGDVYSTAAILFTLLAGAPPPEARAADAVGSARMFGSGEAIPPDIAAVLKVALSEAPDARYETAGALRRELGKLLFSGRYAPSTFNFAFFLTNLLKRDIAEEQKKRNEEAAFDALKYPRPAVTARPPRLVVTPRFGVPVAAVETPEPKRSPVVKIVVGAAIAIAVLGVSGYLLSLKAPKPAPPPPRPAPVAAPAPAPAPPTTGMTPDQFKSEVARRLDEEVKKYETQQKTKQARAEAQARAASLKPVPASIEPSVTAPKPIALPPAAPARAAGAPPVANLRPAPIPIGTAAAPPPAAPTVSRGDLVSISEVDNPPQIVSVVKPEYPPVARRMNISGTVVLAVLVTEAGRVADIRTVREAGGNMGLTQAAQKAVRQWTFRPAMKDGVPVKTWMTIPIPFVL
ncbi:MAG TPA: TonB family protein [Thermoanaerobaculia bacterium]|nr:TonB family protein [Thermoanaerobaculia bacterium]